MQDSIHQTLVAVSPQAKSASVKMPVLGERQIPKLGSNIAKMDQIVIKVPQLGEFPQPVKLHSEYTVRRSSCRAFRIEKLVFILSSISLQGVHKISRNPHDAMIQQTSCKNRR